MSYAIYYYVILTQLPNIDHWVPLVVKYNVMVKICFENFGFAWQLLGTVSSLTPIFLFTKSAQNCLLPYG